MLFLACYNYINFNCLFWHLQLSQAKTNASEAFKQAEAAYQQSDRYLNRTKALINEGNELIANLTSVLNNNTASPDEIQKLAEEVGAGAGADLKCSYETNNTFLLFLDIGIGLGTWSRGNKGIGK